MIKSLDISLYEDGYSLAQIDCLHNPVAAATGYFSRINYFYYCLLHGLLCCMEGYDESTYCNQCNDVLSVIGLKMIQINITNNKTKNIELIKYSIIREQPVILITKYNSLFYNPYYKNAEFKTNHGILVNAVNDETETVGIKDVTLMRDMGLFRDDTIIHYPLQVTTQMLSDIIEYSNLQFVSEDSQFANAVFCIESNKNYANKAVRVIHAIIEILNSKEDELLKYINSDDLKYNFLQDYSYLRMRFYGSLVAFFSALKKIFATHAIKHDEIEDIEREYLDKRNVIINTLYISAKRGENLKLELKEEFCTYIKDNIERLSEYLKKNISIFVDNEYEVDYVNLSALYNNKAFESSIKNDSCADITGEGTHFLSDNVIKGKRWDKGEFSFCLYDSCYYDNISCKGQIIRINTNYSVQRIDLLFCSEYGSYIDKITVKYESGEEYDIEVRVSDFYQPAIYEEYLFWTGIALNRKNSFTTKHSFSARLFAESYSIPSGKIIEIQLPKRKNIHIFALTLRTNKKKIKE